MSSKLSYINLSKRWETAEDIQHVVDDLNKGLYETLQLTGNTLGVVSAEKLTVPLSRQSNLKVLLWNDLFTGRLKSEIGVALKSLSLGLMTAQVNLVELDLSDNAFGPNGVIGVTELLASPCCYTLKTLNMNNQGLGHQGCRKLVDALKTARQNSNKQGMNLEVFIAGRNRLENAGMEMFKEVFGDGMSTLKKIVLLQNGIGIHGITGIKDLMNSLKNHVNLQYLDISDNTVKPEGIRLLSEILPKFTSLEQIHMGDCLLTSTGLDCFTEILDDMSFDLTTICLSGNEIKGRAARRFISKLVETKHSIEKVDLTENEISKTYKYEIKDIVSEYDKSGILVEEECDDDEDEDSEEESSDGFQSEQGESEEESDDESDESEDVESKESVKETNQIPNIFMSAPSASPLIFPKNVTQPQPSSLFRNAAITASQPITAFNLFGTKSSSPAPSSLFTTNSGVPIFTPSVDNGEEIRRFIMDNLLCPSVDTVATSTSIASTAVVSIDSDMRNKVQLNPEVAVRVGLVLCSINGGKSSSFDTGLALITVALQQPSIWSRASNALLVELGAIKSEHKNIKPLCLSNKPVAVAVLTKLLDEATPIGESVRTTLVTVLANLNKVDLLQELENSIGKMKI